jgi:hypothetical protein
VFRIDVLNVDLPEPAGFVVYFEAVGVRVLVGDELAVFVDAEAMASLIPVCPGAAGSIGIGVHVDEEALHPLVVCAGETVADQET